MLLASWPPVKVKVKLLPSAVALTALPFTSTKLKVVPEDITPTKEFAGIPPPLSETAKPVTILASAVWVTLWSPSVVAPPVSVNLVYCDFKAFNPSGVEVNSVKYCLNLVSGSLIKLKL